MMVRIEQADGDTAEYKLENQKASSYQNVPISKLQNIPTAVTII